MVTKNECEIQQLEPLVIPQDEYKARQLANLGRRLKRLRMERGYSNYEQFAFENDIPRAQYGRYEKGHDLRFSSLLKVLKAMDISLEDFFGTGFSEDA